MSETSAVVVTTISAPNDVMRELARGCAEQKQQFVVIGDVSSPSEYDLEDAQFLSVDDQKALSFETAQLAPVRHYARKNIGYLVAAAAGAQVIIDTDDDNFPLPGFWKVRDRSQEVAVVENSGWTNLYRIFSDERIWPRGFPLDEVSKAVPEYKKLEARTIDCPIQQGLVNEDPDVDAIYRLLFPLPQSFRDDRRVALGPSAWCPFNSQNTRWWLDTLELMYLPSSCSFRMTDIWRSFVAQRIARENGWSVLFHEPTMRQERNEHNLMGDFEQEVSGYLNNRALCEELDRLQLEPGAQNLGENLLRCYESLVGRGWIDEAELPRVRAWMKDVAQIRATSSGNPD